MKLLTRIFGNKATLREALEKSYKLYNEGKLSEKAEIRGVVNGKEFIVNFLQMRSLWKRLGLEPRIW
jgi:hypothetical protein